MCFWRFKHQKAECHQTPLYLREYQTSLQPISPKAQQHATVFWWTVPLIAIWAGLITKQTHCWGCNLLTSLLGEGTLWMNSSFAWRCHLFVKEQFKMATPTVSLWASLAVFYVFGAVVHVELLIDNLELAELIVRMFISKVLRRMTSDVGSAAILLKVCWRFLLSVSDISVQMHKRIFLRVCFLELLSEYSTGCHF